jgi:predicted outer membrane repeat protein
MRRHKRLCHDHGLSLGRRSSPSRLEAVVEAMERRLLLSNSPIVVNTAADQVDAVGSSVVSLRDAVNLANSRSGADTIAFDPSVFPPNSFTVITLSRGSLAFTDTTGQTTVDGLGRVAINGQGATTDVVVGPNASVSLQHISIIGGYSSGNGADISNAGTLALAHCDVSAGLAVAGGGIYSTGSLSLTDCAVQNNQAGTGGGIEVDASTAATAATLTGCTLADNTAGTAGGAMDVIAGLVNLSADDFNGNTVSGGGYGGAVGLGGTAYSNVSASKCSFTGNSVNNSSATAQPSGGAIGAYQHGSLNVTGSAFSNNSTSGTGGAIWSEGPVFALSGDTFAGNQAGADGGAVWGSPNISDSTFSNNSSGGNGGAMLSEGTLNLSGCTFSGNSAGAYGGALELHNSASVTGCTFTQNQADSPGGAIDSQAARLSVVDSTFVGNTASQGGAISNRGNLLLDDSTLTNNLVAASGNGGGLYVAGTNDTTTVNNSIIAANRYVPVAGNSGPDDISGSVAGGADLIGTGGLGGLTNGVDGNIVGVANPRLDGLANNGGPTQTIALLAGSPAFAAGNAALLPTGLKTDQRGLPRITDGSLDIGAYQEQQFGTVTGTVFNDANGTGLRDSGEAGIANARVFLDYDGTGVWDQATEPSTVTDAAGVFTFKDLPAVQFSIGLIVPADTRQTTPAGDLVATVAGGKTVNAGLFGEIHIGPGAATLAGVVFNDHNVNGVQGPGDAGLPGVKVFLDLKHTGSFATGDPYTLTGPSGAYVFTKLPPGVYKIDQVLPAGYRQGFPFGGVDYSAVVSANEFLTQFNFGDTTTSRVSGFVYDDLDSQGTAPGETGVDGATVVVDAAAGAGPSYTVTTDVAGYFVAGALPNGVAWKVTLEPPTGYTLVTGTLTRTTAVLGSGQTADNVDFLGRVTVPITFVSQQRTLSASYYVDPEFAPYEGTAMSATGGQGAAATGYGSFDSYTDASFGTQNSYPSFVSGYASQDSTLTATQLTASGDSDAFVNEAGNGAGASYASADSHFQVTFQVYAPQTYSISATLAPKPNHLFESVARRQDVDLPDRPGPWPHGLRQPVRHACRGHSHDHPRRT